MALHSAYCTLHTALCILGSVQACNFMTPPGRHGEERDDREEQEVREHSIFPYG